LAPEFIAALEPLSYYYAKDRLFPAQNSARLKPTKSAQATIGYEKQFNNNLKFKTEAYYQHLYDVPVSVDPNINFSLLDVSDHSAIYSSLTGNWLTKEPAGIMASNFLSKSH
jgi:hypothetical protein